MKHQVTRRSVLALAFLLPVILAMPAQACRVNEAYQPDEPFDEAYFEEADVVFRGYPVAYDYPNPKSGYVRTGYSEVTFEVVETYIGDKKARWTARWFTIAFRKPSDLAAFKREIGDDLVIALHKPSEGFKEYTDLPVIVHRSCHQPAMRSYAVMEPVLRERGLID